MRGRRTFGQTSDLMHKTCLITLTFFNKIHLVVTLFRTQHGVLILSLHWADSKPTFRWCVYKSTKQKKTNIPQMALFISGTNKKKWLRPPTEAAAGHWPLSEPSSDGSQGTFCAACNGGEHIFSLEEGPYIFFFFFFSVVEAKAQKTNKS